MNLLDTSVAIDYLRGVPRAVDLLNRFGGLEALFASELVRFELVGGVREGGVAALDDLFAALSWVPVDETIARVAGSLAQRYRSAYSGIDDADYMIGATALVLSADLLTTNVRHFPMIAGLKAPY